MVTHNSLIEECVKQKSHLDTCCETDKVTLYGYLEKLLTGGPLELALQPHKDTKDGQAVIKSMYLQHGGCTKWEKAHDSRMTQLNTKWNSANGNRTLTNHITMFRVAIMDVIRCCKRTG